MVKPIPPGVSIPRSLGSEFPVESAEELGREFLRLAAKLQDAKQARERAERNLTEFKGLVADRYREDLRRHVGHLSDTIEQFRRTAGFLRDAINEHESSLFRTDGNGSGWNLGSE